VEYEIIAILNFNICSSYGEVRFITNPHNNVRLWAGGKICMLKPAISFSGTQALRAHDDIAETEVQSKQ
jgi:hypothetical protein